MKKKKLDDPKPVESDGLRAALEKVVKAREEERKQLLPKQRRLCSKF
jgi:hypothetical protein